MNTLKNQDNIECTLLNSGVHLCECESCENEVIRLYDLFF